MAKPPCAIDRTIRGFFIRPEEDFEPFITEPGKIVIKTYKMVIWSQERASEFFPNDRDQDARYVYGCLFLTAFAPGKGLVSAVTPVFSAKIQLGKAGEFEGSYVVKPFSIIRERLWH
jgi:hypothetical protein